MIKLFEAQGAQGLLRSNHRNEAWREIDRSLMQLRGTDGKSVKPRKDSFLATFLDRIHFWGRRKRPDFFTFIKKNERVPMIVAQTLPSQRRAHKWADIDNTMGLLRQKSS